MSQQFKPSEVFLNTVPPLAGTLRHAENEHAAALLVRACQVLGDEWRAVGPREIGKVLAEDLDAKREPWASLNRNPFFRPDFRALVRDGFARFTGVGEKDNPIEFTSVGIEALRRWVRSPGVAAQP